MVDIPREIFRNMNNLHVKSIKLTSCVSVVVCGDFCRFKLALPSPLFLSLLFLSGKTS